jgi:hypothetical protein
MSMLVGTRISQKSLYELEGTVDDVIKRLKEDETQIKEVYPQYSNVRLDLSYIGRDDGHELWFIGDRPMTEKEIAEQKETEARSQQWRRDQYERMKKEFGG